MNSFGAPIHFGLPDSADLYFHAATRGTNQRLARSASALGLEFDSPFPEVNMLRLEQGDLAGLLTAWTEELSERELDTVRCRLLASGQSPTIAEMMNSLRLRDLVNEFEGLGLREMLDNQRLETYFQPIVNCYDPNEVYAYECLLRGFDGRGRMIPPFHIYSVARATEFLPQLDEVARLTAIQSASNQSLDTFVFINFNPRSIDQSLTRLRDTVEQARQSDISPEQFVFEVVESDSIDQPDQLLGILDYFREAGCRVALDDLGAGYSSLNLLAQIKPDFVKLDMGLIRDVDSDPYKSHIAAKVLELARDLDVRTIVEGVEYEGEWRWSLENGADFAQGYLFGRPGPNPCSSQFSPAPTENKLDRTPTSNSLFPR